MSDIKTKYYHGNVSNLEDKEKKRHFQRILDES